MQARVTLKSAGMCYSYWTYNEIGSNIVLLMGLVPSPSISYVYPLMKVNESLISFVGGIKETERKA